MGGSRLSAEEDYQKIEEFKAGDRSAFEFLFKKYSDRTYKLLYRLVNNKEDALDLLQIAFLKAYSSLHKFGGRGSFYTWLYRIATNVAIDFLRERGKRPKTRDLAAVEREYHTRRKETSGAAPWAEMLRRELREHVWAAVHALPPEHKAVFLLRTVNGLPYKEIADTVHCPVGTVMSRLHYAREKIREQILPYLRGER